VKWRGSAEKQDGVGVPEEEGMARVVGVPEEEGNKMAAC